MEHVPIQPDDDELELIRRSGVVLRVGRLSLSSGTGSYRVKASMARVAGALGIDRQHAQVTLTEITTTSHRGHSFRTEVTEVRTVGVNTDRLAELEWLAQDCERRGSVPVEEVEAAIDKIADKPPLYPTWLNGVWAGLACAAFAFLNGAGPVEIIGAAIGATLGQALRRSLLHRGYNQFGVTMLASAASVIGYLAFVNAMYLTGVTEERHVVGYVAAALFLVPGFPLVTGALDLAKLDFSAGVSRLTWALMIMVSAAFGVWAISVIVGLRPDTPHWALPVALEWTLRLVASFVGVLGFALMFNGSPRLALTAAAIAAVPNTLRIWAVIDHYWPPQMAAALAAIAIGLLAAWIAPRMNVPRITVYVPAVTIMVPGVLAYRSVYAISQGDTLAAISNGVSAVLIVTALAVGLAIARMLTDREWGMER